MNSRASGLLIGRLGYTDLPASGKLMAGRADSAVTHTDSTYYSEYLYCFRQYFRHIYVRIVTLEA